MEIEGAAYLLIVNRTSERINALLLFLLQCASPQMIQSRLANYQS
jgi:hypothetical protein